MRQIISIVFIALTLASCATYRALPKSSTFTSGGSNERYYNNEGVDIMCEASRYSTKYYCRASNDLFYAHIDPYQTYPCQRIEFYGECGKANSGSLWWNFKDNTTSSLKNGFKTYESSGEFQVEVVCTFIDGNVISATIPVTILQYQRGSSYSAFPGYWYGGVTTDIKTGDTSCPRIELK